MRSRFRPLAAALLTSAPCAAMQAKAVDIVTWAYDLGTFTQPVARFYGHAFHDFDLNQAGLQLAGVPGTVLATDRFYDDHAFVISGSSFSSITATIDLGSMFDISDLQVRLYSGTLATTTTGPAGPALIQAWSSRDLVASGGDGDVQVIALVTLGSGSYVLEVRGNITGTNGGAYSGVFSLAPVPEPGPIAMLLAGVGALGFLRRRNGSNA